MGGGGRYPYPKFVWTPAGGWWAQPASWKMNTFIITCGIAGICAAIVRGVAHREAELAGEPIERRKLTASWRDAQVSAGLQKPRTLHLTTLMPLFKSNTNTTATEAPRSTSPNGNNNLNRNGTSRRGFFGRRNASNESIGSRGTGRANSNVNGPNRANSVTSGRSTGSFFARNNTLQQSIHKDPTIIAAKEKVTSAERAEVEADKALSAARTMVREAKDHVRFLEREAAAEAKRAKAKQAMSNDISRSAGGLGRHGS
ncbi:PALP domain-containing protein [Mycena chlorophos]|uniref:PALP domain-containing protein n=1 Tax=Mycena chlorophos TaxID=658473 RepID=A0A8H6W4X6_MYCCL|nr:PALP domain-containing protein [Mycena chlorophos]